MRLKYLEIGQIASTHGVRGEMKVNAWVDSPEFFGELETVYLGKDGKDPYTLLSYRPHKNQVLITLEGIDNVDKAAPLKNRIIYVDREEFELPEGRNFIAELIGCTVKDADNGREYGKVKEIFNNGANDIWRVESNGKEYYMPDIPGLIVDTDVDEEIVLVRPIKGIFDDAEEIRGE
ncbi:MAG: ribosome maturation factor RimM [Clostridia bacterium]|nr:ribosome maturation factor RimM [Clostridia bacterium]